MRITEIANKLGRSWKSVQMKLFYLGFQRPKFETAPFDNVLVSQFVVEQMKKMGTDMIVMEIPKHG